jgi:hypothetical protein
MGRSGLALASVIVLAVLGALAHASPPDPTYIPGLYDDGDHDDVILLVWSAVGALDALAAPACAVRVVADAPVHRLPALLASAGLGPALTRGPPIA